MSVTIESEVSVKTLAEALIESKVMILEWVLAEAMNVTIENDVSVKDCTRSFGWKWNDKFWINCSRSYECYYREWTQCKEFSRGFDWE